jgi:hypothetical protein
MTVKIEGSPGQHKPFRVGRDAADILASFDTLEDAVRNVRRRRGDWRMSFTTVGRSCGPRAEPRLSNCYRASTAVETNSHSIFVIYCPDIGMG